MTAIGFLLFAACASALWATEEHRLHYAESLSTRGAAILLCAMAGYGLVMLGITIKLWEVMP